MADGFTVDASEFRAIAAQIARSTDGLAKDVRQVVSKGALNVKRQLVSEMGASSSFKGIARDISYDLVGGGLEAQIGPQSGPGNAGALANIAYFGGSRGGGTVPDPDGALQAEGPRFEKALGDLLGGLL